MKIIRKLQSLSLRQRLIIAVLFFVLLPWIITYLISNYLTKDMLEQRAVKQSEDVLFTVESNISAYFDDMMYLSNFVQFDTGFATLLKEYRNIDEEDSRFVQKNALQHIKINRYLEAVTNLLTPSYLTILLKGELYYTNYSTREYDPLQFYEEQWFKRMKEGQDTKTFWLGTHSSYIRWQKEKSPYMITVARQLKEFGRTYGYTIISIDEREIHKAFTPFSEQEDRKLLLVHENGTILSSEEPTEVLQMFPFHIGQGRDYQIVDYEGKKQLLVSVPFLQTDWKIVSLVPYKETVGAINIMTRTTLLIQGGFLLLFLAGLIILVKEITKPISLLSQVTKKVKTGDLHVRSNIRGNGDVAQLGESFDHMLDQIEEMVETIKIQEKGKRKAELEMLQAQINPHFLFNVLNALRLNILINKDEESAKLIHSLSSLLRMTINRNNEFITLREEISVVKDYVRLMNFRHRSHVELNMNISDEVLSEQVPRFFLQPLIENAIIHGFFQRAGEIQINAWYEGTSFLFIEVKDNGAGMDNGELEALRTRHLRSSTQNETFQKESSFSGIGTVNVYQRLCLIYGKRFHMEIDSGIEKGTSVSFYLPRE